MKIIVTHSSPDWDAITSVWILKRYLLGWENAEVVFVPAGQKYKDQKVVVMSHDQDPIEKYGEDEVIHTDTGMVPLDHHQTSDKNVCGASLCWDYVLKTIKNLANKEPDKVLGKEEAISRIVKIIVDIDHFGEVFWAQPDADYHEFSLLGLLEGLKMQTPGDDSYYLDMGMVCLDALVHDFENRIWAEKEIANAQQFDTRFGKGIAFETINDSVIKLSQKMGFVIVIRKDPRKGYVRIKTLPATEYEKGADLTLAYEQLSKMDPLATWYLHVGKKMLLNGTPKNPKMIPTSLTLEQIVKVVEKI